VRKGRLVLVIAASLAVVSALIAGALVLTRDAATAPEPFFDNLLENPSFEGGQSNNLIDTIRWVDGVGPLYNVFGNIYTPDGWRVWWREGDECPAWPDGTTARPEARVVHESLDPFRIYEGSQAALAFTFYRCHDMGLLQQVDVVTGTYDVTAYAHSMYTSCSSEPHGPPLDSDCETLLSEFHDLLTVGIDPAGGIDPNAPGVIWSTPIEQYGMYSQQLELRGVELGAGTVTVFLRAKNNFPARHNDVFIDSVELRQEPWCLWLPVVEVGGSAISRVTRPVRCV
jgi:hypothetical protein